NSMMRSFSLASAPSAAIRVTCTVPKRLGAVSVTDRTARNSPLAYVRTTTSPRRTFAVATVTCRCGNCWKKLYPYQAAPATATSRIRRRITFFIATTYPLLQLVRLLGGLDRILESHHFAFLESLQHNQIRIVPFADFN